MSIFSTTVRINSLKQKLIDDIRTNALEFGEFKLKGGETTNFYLDLRKITLSGSLSYIIELIHTLAVVYKFPLVDAVGGPSIGADPIVGGWISYAGQFSDVRGFLIRKEEKGYGKDGLVIGSVRKGDKCIVVEDTITSGNSLLRTVDIIEEYGCKVVAAMAIVDRLQGAREKFEARCIRYEPILTVNELFWWRGKI